MADGSVNVDKDQNDTFNATWDSAFQAGYKKASDFYKSDRISLLAEADKANHAERENAALTTQLEEAKGKLAIATETLATIKYHEERLVDAHIRDYQQEPERRELILNDRYYYKLVCKALSPDIKRYREEIEREAVKAFVASLEDLACDYDASGGPTIVLMSDIQKAYKSLLPNQKEVSDDQM